MAGTKVAPPDWSGGDSASSRGGGAPTAVVEARLRASSIGWRVDLSGTCRGLVHSVFSQAVNCVVDGHLWTVLPEAAPDAPFGVRLDGPVRPGDLGVRPGDPVYRRAGFVALGPAVLDCRSSSRWSPAPPPPLVDGWAERFDHLGARAAPVAWDGSAELAARLAGALMDRPTGPSLPQAVDGAVGRGAGLTPSGDDVLVGLFAALGLAATGADRPDQARTSGMRRRLGRALAATPSRTTDVSRHLLDQAGQGWFGAVMHNVLGALAGGDIRAVSRAADALLATGATSGADTGVGLAAGGRLLFSLRPEGTLP